MRIKLQMISTIIHMYWYIWLHNPESMYSYRVAGTWPFRLPFIEAEAPLMGPETITPPHYFNISGRKKSRIKVDGEISGIFPTCWTFPE